MALVRAMGKDHHTLQHREPASNSMSMFTTVLVDFREWFLPHIGKCLNGAAAAAVAARTLLLRISTKPQAGLLGPGSRPTSSTERSSFALRADKCRFERKFMTTAKPHTKQCWVTRSPTPGFPPACPLVKNGRRAARKYVRPYS